MPTAISATLSMQAPTRRLEDATKTLVLTAPTPTTKSAGGTLQVALTSKTTTVPIETSFFPLHAVPTDTTTTLLATETATVYIDYSWMNAAASSTDSPKNLSVSTPGGIATIAAKTSTWDHLPTTLTTVGGSIYVADTSITQSTKTTTNTVTKATSSTRLTTTSTLSVDGCEILTTYTYTTAAPDQPTITSTTTVTTYNNRPAQTPTLAGTTIPATKGTVDITLTETIDTQSATTRQCIVFKEKSATGATRETTYTRTIPTNGHDLPSTSWVSNTDTTTQSLALLSNMASNHLCNSTIFSGVSQSLDTSSSTARSFSFFVESTGPASATQHGEMVIRKYSGTYIETSGSGLIQSAIASQTTTSPAAGPASIPAPTSPKVLTPTTTLTVSAKPLDNYLPTSPFSDSNTPPRLLTNTRKLQNAMSLSVGDNETTIQPTYSKLSEQEIFIHHVWQWISLGLTAFISLPAAYIFRREYFAMEDAIADMANNRQRGIVIGIPIANGVNDALFGAMRDVDNPLNPEVVVGVPVVGMLRRLAVTESHTSDLELIRRSIKTAHEMLFSNPDKMVLLLNVEYQIALMLKSSDLSDADKQYIYQEIVPQLNAESTSVFAYDIATKGFAATFPSHTLLVNTVPTHKPWVNLNDWTKSPYAANSNFFDTSKTIVRGQDSAGQTRIINLAGEDTQYNAGPDNTTDIVAISTRSTNARTYNISTGGGDDVVILNSATFTNPNTVVNLVGGAGSDTYIIKVKDGLSPLPGKIRILDFNFNQDKVIFDTENSYLQPNITHTWHGEMYRPVSQYYDDKGLLQLKSQLPNIVDVWNVYRQADFATGMRDTFEGVGIPTVEIWSMRDRANPDKTFLSYEPLKTTYLGDIPSDDTSTAFLLPNNDYQICYSQFENRHDFDLYKLDLKAGNFYRFHISANSLPCIIDSSGPISKTQLVVAKKNADGTQSGVDLSHSAIVNPYQHDYQISFVAPSDGQYNLYAGSNNQTPVGTYQIEFKQATPQSFTPYQFDPRRKLAEGQFKGDKDFQVFTTDLKAGQYIDVADFGRTSDISIYDPNGEKIAFAYQIFTNEDNSVDGVGTFLANGTGRYSFVLDDNTTNPVQDFRVLLSLRYPFAGTQPLIWGDIEGDVTTHADLKAGVTILNTIEGKGDHDYFRVNLQGNTKYQFDLKRDISQNSKNNLDPYISLRGLTGAELMKDTLQHPAYSNDEGAVPKVASTLHDSKLVYKIGTAGTYYIDVGAFMNNSLGDYSLAYKVIA